MIDGVNHKCSMRVKGGDNCGNEAIFAMRGFEADGITPRTYYVCKECDDHICGALIGHAKNLVGDSQIEN